MNFPLYTVLRNLMKSHTLTFCTHSVPPSCPMYPYCIAYTPAHLPPQFLDKLRNYNTYVQGILL